MQQRLRRLEMTKNKLDTELNSLKPEIKRLQAEKANKLRCVRLSFASLITPVCSSIVKFTKVSPGPSEIGHNSFISQPILKPLTPVDSS